MNTPLKLIKRSFFIFLLFFFQLLILAQGTKENSRCQSFDFNWRFHLGEIHGVNNPEFNDLEWRSLNLPHDWSIEGKFSDQNASGTGYLPGDIGWYRKEFALPDTYKNKNVGIQFDGVYENSEVWINGRYLWKRPFGFISFYYDLTPYLKFGNNKNWLKDL